MAADYEGEVAAHRAVDIAVDGSASSYMVASPETDAYFIDNIDVEPAPQGKGLGRRLVQHAAAEADRLRRRVRARIRSQRLERHTRAQDTPVDIVEKLNAVINAGLADAKIEARLADLAPRRLTTGPAY